MKAIKYIGYGIGSLLILGILYMVITQKNVNEIALDLFSLVKSIRGQKVELKDIQTHSSKTLDHSEWTNLLQNHVLKDGRVNYKGFIDDEALLDTYLDQLSKNPPSKLQPTEEQLAYWINAYNAFTIKLIIDHYPLQSIKDISNGLPMINSPWDIQFFKIGGVDFDLNTIEHEILRREFYEPRIHFAINCASISCPKLRNEAYVAEQLDQQLNQQAIEFINDTSKNKITQSNIEVSQIFNWFRRDFTKTSTLKSYLSQYHGAINAENKVLHLPYDWGLNE